MDDGRLYDGDAELHMGVEHRVQGSGHRQLRSTESVDKRDADGVAAYGNIDVQSHAGCTWSQ